MGEKFYTTAEAAHYLREHNMPFSKSTLDTMRHLGTGPVFTKIGKSVFYAQSDLDEYIALNPPTKHRSTSEYSRMRPKIKASESTDEPTDGGEK
jgi:Helix-turn-helix domain